MPKRVLKLACPICKNPVKDTHPEFPFCSARCRTIDLGRWGDGHYVVSTPLSDAAQDASPPGPDHSGSDDE